jgi:hypothetical protein
MAPPPHPTRPARAVVPRQGIAAAASAATLLALAACSGDPMLALTAVDAPQIAIHIVAGDRQHGIGGDTLAPITAQVTDLQGAPLPGVAVLWRVTDDGAITPQALTTDGNGRATARWKLGRADEHDGTASIAQGPAAPFSAAEHDSPTLDLLEVGMLRPPTYEGSRETVHPDFARTPDDWGAYTQHLALTPYPNGASQLENPSVFVSRSGLRWFLQAGVINPLVTPGADGYLSDPDIVYHPQLRELWMYYRRVDSRNSVFLVRSKNGSDWSAPVSVVSAANHMLVSPSVVRRDEKTWLMWSVNGGVKGCGDVTSSVQLRRSADGLKWGPPITVSLSNNDLTPWHLDVQWVPSLNQYWALYPAKRAGSCATQSLFLATSADGVTWTTYPTPVLVAGEIPELKDIVYRSTFEYDASTDEIRFWFSGANLGATAYNWRTVLQRHSRTGLFAKISAPRSPLAAYNTNRMLPAMLNPP